LSCINDILPWATQLGATSIQVGGSAMIRLISLILSLSAAAVGLLVASDAWNFEFVESFAAIILIVGFAVAATGWTIRHDV
jgi:hypothetical protein